MTDISATIRTLALSIGDISTSVGTRMYSDILITDATLPAIVYTVIDTVPSEHLSGVESIARSRIQIDAYGNTRTTANDLAEDIRIGLQKYRGTVGATFINEINLAVGAVHDFDKDGPFYITTQDFIVTYRL